MTTKYNRLFSVSMQHNFYKNGVHKSLVLKPDTTTAVLTRNGKMLFRTLGNDAIVLYKADADKTSPFIDLGKDVVFRYYLTLENSEEFFNITNLDGVKKYEVGNKLYFTNNPANASTHPDTPELLTHSLIGKAFSPLFTYSFSLTTTHTKTKFKLTDQNGNLISVGKDQEGNDLPTILNLSRDDNKKFHQQVDLRNKPNGIYTITIRNDADATTLREETVLIDNEALHQGVLGVVDIRYDSATGHLYGATEYYRLNFERKTAVWKYFIVNKTKTQLDYDDVLNTSSLTIEDSPTGGGAPYTHVDFNLDGTEPRTDIKVKGFHTVVFKSSAEIPSFEDPKLNVELVLKPSDKKVVAHLSNPPINTVEKDNGGVIEKEIFVFI
ncbi:MAG: hypothetical protein R3299_07390 [Arenibacter sp.]|nr:hypothetical protein [Arenibacter sp.]